MRKNEKNDFNGGGELDNSQVPNSRWYSGAGIYRPVHLTIQEQQYIEEVKISTLSIAPATIKVETSHQGGEVTVCIYDGNKQVASAEGDNVELKMEGAKLWSADHPNLYKAVVDPHTVEEGYRQLHSASIEHYLPLCQ